MVSNFSRMPSVSISRSKFNRKSQYKTSVKLGDLVPIYCDEVLPGDTRSIDLGSLIRMSTPIAPIMDNIYADVYAFFVPNRLVWTHWKEFMGENNSSAGIYSGTEYVIPSVAINGLQSYSLGDYYGLPTSLSGSQTKVSLLPIRGYRRIYNRFFRDQNIIAPLTVSTGDSASTGDVYTAMPQKVAKVSDYFTRSLPYAQKGAPVTIPLGTEAPLMAKSTSGAADIHGNPEGNLHGMGNPIHFAHLNGSGGYMASMNGYWMAGNGKVYMSESDFDEYDYPVNATNLYTDLSQATSATINQLRFAFQYQKLLEKDALYGTRYWEIIKAHFGVTAPDASLQDPELLGHRKIWINIDQVVQTTGINQSTPASNTLGQTAAVSVTGDKCNLFTKSFSEHGYIQILVCFRHDQTYGQGIERHWSRVHRTDYYFPVFANLGAQSVLCKEIYATGVTGTNADDKIFGYQEAWAEYRYKPSKVTGILNPHVASSLGYWTLANNFGTMPTLGQTFIEQDRSNLARALSTGSSGPDFICDFAFLDVAVRPMPLYSIPGLIDHH